MEASDDFVYFFNYLSKRIYKENDLSDITWALCNSNNDFKHLFLNYCFDEDTPDMEIFEREATSNDSRPDFYCEDKEGKKWIIEVKINIWTEGQLEKYRKEFKDAKIAFIANYNASALCDKKLQISIKTWKGFIDFLQENTDNTIINGYIRYLKNIMAYLEVQDMNLNNIISLPDFNRVIDYIICNYNKKKLEFYNIKSNMSFERYGRSVTYKNKNGITWFWIGIYYCDEKNKIPYLCIEFNVDDPKSVPKEEASKLKSIKDGEYSYKPDFWDGVAYFYLTDKYHDILFSDNPEIEKQKEIITKFLDEILDYIE